MQWSRFINGDKTPTRRSVKALVDHLGATEGVRADQLLVLWDRAFGIAPAGREATGPAAATAVPPQVPLPDAPGRQRQVTEPALDRAAGKLATMVADECARELNDRVLQGWDPLVVRWRPLPGQDADQEATRDVTAGSTSDVTALARFVRGGRGLVILGPGEAGKSTLATFLMRELLAARTAGSDPVPVFVQAESLRPGETVPSWLRRTIAERYPPLRDTRAYGSDAIGELIARQRVIPVIDALDDLVPHARGQLLTALRRAFGQDQRLIVTCQAAEYHQAVTAAKRVLADAAVIEMLPVTADDAARFLERGAAGDHARHWELITGKLRSDPEGPLARSLSSPLMTGLLRSAYDADAVSAAELISCDDQAAIENRILNSLFITTFSTSVTSQHAQPRRSWDPRRADRWLTFLATYLARRRSNDLDWPRLRQAVGAFTTPARWALLGALLAFTLAGTAFAVSGAFQFAAPMRDAVLNGLARGLDAACVVSAVYLLAGVSYPPGARMPRWLAWLRLRMRTPLAMSAVIPAGYAVESAVRDGIIGGIAHGTTAGVQAGLTGLAVNWLIASAILFLAVHGNLVQLADNPVYWSLRMPGRARGFARALAAGVAWGSCLGLSIGFGIDLASSTLAHENPRWPLGAIAGAVIGAAFALVRWGRTPVQSALATSPRSVLQSDRTLVLLLAGVFLVVIPAIFAAAFPDRAVSHAWYGLGIGITIWLAIALSHAWPQYLIATCWLAVRGRVPLRLASFLDDAHRLQILRQRGVAYQFRHPRIRDHLADMEQ